MGQPVVHWELWSKDPSKTAEFYRSVFEWEIQHIPDLNYHVVNTGGAGGLDAYAQKIKKAGGTIIVDKLQVPGMGSFTLFQDPDNYVLGIWNQHP